MFNKLLTIPLIVLSLLFSATSVLADTFKINQPGGVPVTFQSTQPYAEGLVEMILVNVIAIFFTVGGIGVLIYFIWGTVDWILSGGDKEKIAGARKKITNAIVGLVLLSLSYFIINLIGSIVGFNPLSNLQIKGLGDPNPAAPNN